MSELKVGDILESSWGYDQTNATFYKVIKRTPSYVTIVKLQKTRVWDDEGYNVLGVVPTDEPLLKHDSTNCQWEATRSTLEVIGEFHLHQDDAADLDCFVPITSRHKVNPGSDYIRIASYAGASLWDGTPQYDTSAAGHMGH